jgi:hypothetical protein
MNRPDEVSIRRLRPEDCEPISKAFTAIGWNKPVEQYQHYLEEQASDTRPVLVAFVDGEFAGYVTVRWQPHYSAFPKSRT